MLHDRAEITKVRLPPDAPSSKDNICLVLPASRGSPLKKRLLSPLDYDGNPFVIQLSRQSHSGAIPDSTHLAHTVSMLSLHKSGKALDSSDRLSVLVLGMCVGALVALLTFR